MSTTRDVNPLQLVAQALSQHPLVQQASSTLRRWQSNAEHSNRTMHAARLPPRVVVLPRCNLPLAAVIPGDGVAEQVLTTGLSNFLNLYNTALICRLVLTWFPNPPAFIEQPLSTLCDPYLNLFRGLIPPIGGSLDFSPILAFVVLNLFTSTAAALPAEVGPDGRRVASVETAQAGPLQWLQPSRYQRMWAGRVRAERLRRAAEDAQHAAGAQP